MWHYLSLFVNNMMRGISQQWPIIRMEEQFIGKLKVVMLFIKIQQLD